MMIDKTSTFHRIFHKNLLHIQVLTFDMNGQEEAEAVPFYRFQLPLPQKFATSGFRFHIPGYNITKRSFFPLEKHRKGYDFRGSARIFVRLA